MLEKMTENDNTKGKKSFTEDFRKRIKDTKATRWVRFGIVMALFVAWVAWMQSWWLLVFALLLFDIYITGYIPFTWWKTSKSSFTRTVMSWVDAIVYALILVYFIFPFIAQNYQIPSSSLEKTLLTGDYLVVNKFVYGPRVPMTPVHFPLVHNSLFGMKSYADKPELSYKRLKGLRDVEEGDIVVFNFPAGDTVLLQRQDATYYDVLRGYEESFGKEEGRKRLAEKYTIVSRPVDKRENYIKRCVAIPGDSLEVRDGQVWVNGSPQEPFPGIQYQYVVQVTSPLTQYALDNLGITEYTGNGSMYYMFLTDEAAEKVKALGNVLSVRRYIYTPNTDVFPQWAEPRWSQDNYGPIWIPQKGATVQLTAENLPLYRRIIETYEGHELEERDGRIYIDGAEAGSYTFGMDYYWMMGDNRHNSADSRFWGFVPEDHIVGKASFVWLSLDANKSFPANIRWNRLFTKVR